MLLAKQGVGGCCLWLRRGGHGAVAPSRRPISSGTTNGIPWFNTSATSVARCQMESTFLVTLGTSSGAPTKFRGVSATLLKNAFYTYLFDAGENTQWRLRNCYPVQLARLNKIFITHLHGDHVFGLPGVLASALEPLAASARDAAGLPTDDGSSRPYMGGMGVMDKFPANCERISVYGPVGLHKFLTGAFATYHVSSAQKLPIDVFELLPPGMAMPLQVPRGLGRLTYLKPNNDGVYELFTECRFAPHDEHTVYAAPLDHTVQCLGYVVEQKQKFHANPQVLLANGAEERDLGSMIQALRAGSPVHTPSGRVVLPGDAMIPGSPAMKVVVMGDNRGAPAMLPLAQGADLLVHEATLAPGEEAKALFRGHSTARLAGKFAAACGAKRLMLTHFGQWFAPTYNDSNIEALGRLAVQRAVYTARQMRQVPSPPAASPLPTPSAQPQWQRAPSFSLSSPSGDAAALMSDATGEPPSPPQSCWRCSAGEGDAADPLTIGNTDTAFAAVLETIRMPTIVGGHIPTGVVHTSVGENFAQAVRMVGCTTDQRLVTLRRYGHPRVDDTPLVRPVVRAAQDAMQCEQVLAARDFMGVPLDFAATAAAVEAAVTSSSAIPTAKAAAATTAAVSSRRTWKSRATPRAGPSGQQPAAAA